MDLRNMQIQEVSELKNIHIRGSDLKIFKYEAVTYKICKYKK